MASDKFKEAIKSNNREIKGYVEILYVDSEVKNNASFSTSITAYDKSNLGELFDNDRKGTDYASFEEGFFRLDGSLAILDDTSNTGVGFISNDIFANLTDKSFTITTTSDKEVEGMTLYFNDNIPTDLTIIINGTDTYNITGNSKRFIQVKFNNKTAVNNAVITINNVERPDWRIRLQEIDFGLSGLYEGTDLIEFSITEEVSKLAEEMPINEFSVQIDNYSKQFDPINPQGLTAYLSSTTVLRPYIGVNTDTGVEYEYMGEYYLYKWENNSDGSTTFVGRNILQQLSQEQLLDGSGTFFKILMRNEEFLNFVNSNYNYNFLLNTGHDGCGMTYAVDYTYLKDFLLDYALKSASIIYADRDNTIHIEQIDSTIKDTLARTDLIDNAMFTITDKINVVEIVRPTLISGKTSYGEDDTYVNVVNQKVILSKDNEVFAIRNSSGNIFGLETLTHEGGSDAQVLSTGYYMAFIQVTGTAGEEVQLTGTAIDTQPSSTSSSTYYSNKQTNEDEHRFTFDSPLNYGYSVDYLGNYILNQAYKYEVSLNYIGLPYLTAGDTINVETEYGYKAIFITKSELKFDGGLTGSITGVGN